MEGGETNQLVVLVGSVVEGWAGFARFTTPVLTWFSAPILTRFSAPVLAPAPGLGSAPVLTVCCLLGDVSGKIVEEGKWTDFVVYRGSEGSNGEGEEEDDRGKFKAEHGEG